MNTGAATVNRGEIVSMYAGLNALYSLKEASLRHFEFSRNLKVTSEGCFDGSDWKPADDCEIGWKLWPQNVGVDGHNNILQVHAHI